MVGPLEFAQFAPKRVILIWKKSPPYAGAGQCTQPSWSPFSFLFGVISQLTLSGLSALKDPVYAAASQTHIPSSDLSSELQA